MKKGYAETLFGKILVPVIYGCELRAVLAVARAVACNPQILLVGLVPISKSESLSTAAAPAREVRNQIRELMKDGCYRCWERVLASHQPWQELVQVAQAEKPDLLVLEWPGQYKAMQTEFAQVLTHPPCDMAIVSGPIPEQPEKVLVSLRGGPYAELALRLSLAIGRNSHAQVGALHLIDPGSVPRQDAAFRGIDRVLTQLPEVERIEIQTKEPANVILEESRQYDLIVMGASAQSARLPVAIGPVTEAILRERKTGMIVVKTRRPLPANMESESAGNTAISVLVDKWFAENTYHAEEFSDLHSLMALKRQQGVTISLALPALNEEETVGNVIQTVKGALMDSLPLLDEIVLIDSNSSDRTRQIASDLGVPVYIHQELLPELGARAGKGEALWKSLLVTRGDIVLWIDTDIVNIHPSFVYGLIGPLLHRPGLQLVKGFYRRPLKVDNKLQASGGGRVTELTARPLINLFYPEISGIIQPLAGEYGGRRSALEKLPFYSGYGVEIGLLIDMLEHFGLSAIAQVDLQERIHHNQSLESLSKMSFAIIQAVFHKLENRAGSRILEDVNKTMKLIRYSPGRFYLDVEEIAEKERPPMINLAEYRALRAIPPLTH